MLLAVGVAAAAAAARVAAAESAVVGAAVFRSLPLLPLPVLEFGADTVVAPLEPPVHPTSSREHLSVAEKVRSTLSAVAL